MKIVLITINAFEILDLKSAAHEITVDFPAQYPIILMRIILIQCENMKPNSIGLNFLEDGPPEAHHKSTKAPVTRLRSEDLFANGREVEIVHEGKTYRLRLTQLNKLILTA